jgi:hypothetical protein
MQTKTDQIRAAWLAGDRVGALRIAARFFDRSNETMIFKRGMDAHNHAQFYRQIGQEPQELITAALDLLAKAIWSALIVSHRERDAAVVAQVPLALCRHDKGLSSPLAQAALVHLLPSEFRRHWRATTQALGSVVAR